MIILINPQHKGWHYYRSMSLRSLCFNLSEAS